MVIAFTFTMEMYMWMVLISISSARIWQGPLSCQTWLVCSEALSSSFTGSFEKSEPMFLTDYLCQCGNLMPCHKQLLGFWLCGFHLMMSHLVQSTIDSSSKLFLTRCPWCSSFLCSSCLRWPHTSFQFWLAFSRQNIFCNTNPPHSEVWEVWDIGFSF